MKYGYVRVSTLGQLDGNSIEEQTNAIKTKYPDCTIFTEAYSGAKERPLFSKLIERCQAGDMIIVTKLDRFCRTTKEGLEYIDILMSKGVDIHIMNMGLIENTPMGKLIVTTLLAFAEFERASIIERTQSGKAIARKKKGYREGRPRLEVENFKEYYNKTQLGVLSVNKAIKKLGISRSKWYSLCNEN